MALTRSTRRPAVAQRRGDHAERDADDERDDERVEHELEGRGAVGRDDLHDRLVVGDGRAEVEGEDAAEVLDVLQIGRS
jgi:hypothetical protein